MRLGFLTSGKKSFSPKTLWKISSSSIRRFSSSCKMVRICRIAGGLADLVDWNMIYVSLKRKLLKRPLPNLNGSVILRSNRIGHLSIVRTPDLQMAKTERRKGPIYEPGKAYRAVLISGA
jgi:hypothetical protein